MPALNAISVAAAALVYRRALAAEAGLQLRLGE